MTSWDTLIPVIVGGAIGLFGGLIGPPISHYLNAEADRRKKQSDKFEELLSIVYEHRHWLNAMQNIRVFGQTDTQPIDPLPRAMAIASIYFPQLDSQLIELEDASSHYLLWMSEQGVKRLAGKLDDINEGLAEAYLPAYRKSVQVIYALRAIGAAEFHASRPNKK